MNMINRFAHRLFSLCIVWPVLRIWLGLRVHHRERLPQQGPAIIVANHNSHLDIFTLLSLFPLRKHAMIRPVAAADYFLRNRLLAWFTQNILNIIPVVRGGDTTCDPLAACADALRQNQILILFPEGTRGEPEKISGFKSGLWYLAQSFPETPIVPVYLKGLGRSMGKGRHIPLPLFIDIHIDEPCYWQDDKQQFKDALQARFTALQQQTQGQQHG